jgi:hypothetical protein
MFTESPPIRLAITKHTIGGFDSSFCYVVGGFMFRITDGKGFGVQFENGYTVSVQFGPGNYADHYDRRIGRDEVDCGREGSMTAECAVINQKGELIEHPLCDGDTVSGRNTAEQVLTLLNWAASQST